MRARHRRRTAGPWGVALAGLALLGLALGTSGTLSGWTDGSVANTAGSASAGTLAFTHAYQSTTCAQGLRTGGTLACAGSIAPTEATPASGSVTGTDTITDNGNLPASRLQHEFRAASCGPVMLANRKRSTNPLLARYGMTFHTSGGPMDSAGYVTLDGDSPGGYATSVVAQSQPPTSLLSLGTLSGVGVWFKASSGTTGPLFSFSASAANGGGDDDRAAYLDGRGRLNLVWNTYGSKLNSSASYTDGAWHFAYATFGRSLFGFSLVQQVVLYVDGTSVDSTLLSFLPFDSYDGYWHLGWAPTSVTGLGTAYVAASLSNFVVINSNPPSGSSIGKPATQADFNSRTSTSTEHWVLDDSGTTTFSGTLPSSMTSPCGMVTIAWATTNPAGTVTAATPLSTFADNTWHAVTAPGPGASQTSTITTARGSGYNTDISGLHLYVPLSHRVQSVPTGSSWQQTFTWSDATAAFIG